MNASDYFVAEAYVVEKGIAQRATKLGKIPPFTSESALSPSLQLVLAEKRAAYLKFCGEQPLTASKQEASGAYPVVDLEQNENNNFTSPCLPTLVTHGHLWSLSPQINRDMIGDEHLLYQLWPTPWPQLS